MRPCNFFAGFFCEELPQIAQRNTEKAFTQRRKDIKAQSLSFAALRLCENFFANAVTNSFANQSAD
jgi:hypothetical protein